MDTIEDIIVYFMGVGLYVDSTTAKKYNLRNGYRIRSEKEYWEIFGASNNQSIENLKNKMDKKHK